MLLFQRVSSLVVAPVYATRLRLGFCFDLELRQSACTSALLSGVQHREEVKTQEIITIVSLQLHYPQR